MLSKSVSETCSTAGPASTEVSHHHCRKVFLHQSDDGGNQSDSSNSNSSLVSTSRYNERYPRAFDGNKKSNSAGGRSFNAGNSSSARGSFAVIGSRTSLPPLDENNTLSVTESQLSLKLRRATRSTSWTNQKILDTIDGLKTSIQELDPCIAVDGKEPIPIEYTEANDSNSNTESSRHGSEEVFVLPKSISNLIMKSRSSGTVNPLTSAQNRENSCYNFLSGIREDEDEEQQQDDAHGGITGTGIRLSVTPAQEKRKHNSARGGESPKNCEENSTLEDHGGTKPRHFKKDDVKTRQAVHIKKSLQLLEQHYTPVSKTASDRLHSSTHYSAEFKEEPDKDWNKPQQQVSKNEMESPPIHGNSNPDQGKSTKNERPKIGHAGSS